MPWLRTPAELRRHLVFREALRADPGLVKEYAALKQELARRFRNDREAYTLAKSDFIEAVLSQAQPASLEESRPLAAGEDQERDEEENNDDE